jgi:hypothetical protein
MSPSTMVVNGPLVLGATEAKLLQSHCERLLRWDARATARIVISGNKFGLYAAPPLGVITYICLPLANSGERAIDVTIPVPQIVNLLQESATEAGVEFTLPDSIPGIAELAVLPPEDGWQLPISAISSDVTPMVMAAVEEFRSRAITSVDTDELASEIWGRHGFGGLPLRVFHAARLLGLLANDSSRIAAVTRTGWKRLVTVRGQVYVRVPGALDRPALTVVR